MNTCISILCFRTRLRIVKDTTNKNKRRSSTRTRRFIKSDNVNTCCTSPNPLYYNLTVAEVEDLVFQSIPQNPKLKQQISEHIDHATKIAEKKTTKDRIEQTSVKQDAFINVNTFLGGILLFGLTGRRSSKIVPDRTVLELQLLTFFIFLGSIMSSLMFMLFVKFHGWKKYKPYQDALVMIKRKAELIWWTNNTNIVNNHMNTMVGSGSLNKDDDQDQDGHYFVVDDDDEGYSHHNNNRLLFNEWNSYQQYQSIMQVKKKRSKCNSLKVTPVQPSIHNEEEGEEYDVSYDGKDNDNNVVYDDVNDDHCNDVVIKENTEEENRMREFSKSAKEVLEIAAREEGRARETLRRWSIMLPFTLTCIGIVFLCIAVFMGADIQLHTGVERDQSHEHHLETWIYYVAPLFLMVPFWLSLGLIRYYTGRLHDFFE